MVMVHRLLQNRSDSFEFLSLQEHRGHNCVNETDISGKSSEEVLFSYTNSEQLALQFKHGLLNSLHIKPVNVRNTRVQYEVRLQFFCFLQEKLHCSQGRVAFVVTIKTCCTLNKQDWMSKYVQKQTNKYTSLHCHLAYLYNNKIFNLASLFS